ECQTEQYLSRESWIARATRCSGIWPASVKRRFTFTIRFGSLGARSATRCAVRPVSAKRPRRSTARTSITMQPARAKASAWTGDGPAAGEALVRPLLSAGAPAVSPGCQLELALERPVESGLRFIADVTGDLADAPRCRLQQPGSELETPSCEIGHRRLAQEMAEALDQDRTRRPHLVGELRHGPRT